MKQQGGLIYQPKQEAKHEKKCGGGRGAKKSVSVADKRHSLERKQPRFNMPQVGCMLGAHTTMGDKPRLVGGERTDDKGVDVWKPEEMNRFHTQRNGFQLLYLHQKGLR